MKICILHHEYEPFPGGGIGTYHNVAAKVLARAGHQVHVVTNNCLYGRTEPHLAQPLCKDGNLTVHRLSLFNADREVPDDARFFDLDPREYRDRTARGSLEASNFAARRLAAYAEQLHAREGLDLIESPEFFAEAFYIIRQRRSGRRHLFPPVCVHGHTSSRLAYGTNAHMWELGFSEHRQLMQREDYCIQHADALLTPSRSLMELYDHRFDGALPALRQTLPYYLEVGECAERPPAALAGGFPYLISVGRIEPRKGSDLALRAFTTLAGDHPDLRLVFLGTEMWRTGEPFDRVIEGIVPPEYRDRILRLGNVPRDQALAAMRDSTAFIHPTPWDNYPCAVLEAMGVGAVCLVSDSGGQAEMVEDGRSGLVHRAGDHRGMAECLRRLLADAGLRGTLAAGARRRVEALTDVDGLTREKIGFFERIIEKDRRRTPPLQTRPTPSPGPELPAEGRIVFDCGGAPGEVAASTVDSITKGLEGVTGWQVLTIADGGEPPPLPTGWQAINTVDPPPWLTLPAEMPLVYLKAGVRFDRDALLDLIHLVTTSPVPCGGFLWLRPTGSPTFPFRPDFSWHDLVVSGGVLPPAFAVKAGHLAACKVFAGLIKPDYRLASLLATSSAAHRITFRHTGAIAGEYRGTLTVVDEDLQTRTLGYLESHGLLPAEITLPGHLEPPRPPAGTGVLGLLHTVVRKIRRTGRGR